MNRLSEYDFIDAHVGLQTRQKDCCGVFRESLVPIEESLTAPHCS